MLLPVSWIRDFVELPEHLTARALGEALVRVGLEVERVDSAADALSGPIVVGRVLTRAPEAQKNGKTINWCSVDVGEAEPRGIVCGAHNFDAGDLVVVSLPGAVLPGGFAIARRKTYGHWSDGMICSTRELGLGDEHDGILVLPPDSAAPGASAVATLGLDDAVLDIAVTPDRGYCFSMRGLAREASIALSAPFTDVAHVVTVPEIDGRAYPLADDICIDGCDQFAVRTVSGLDARRASPDWLASRLRLAGMRPISLIVDVTNYVMLETGQPLHAFDRTRLVGPLGARRARTGETLVTLDGQARVLDVDDLVVTDDSGPLALAGVMGGASSEITDSTTDIVLEAAHWDPASTLRTVRRHKLPSEAAKRFERGVDPAVAAVALTRCVDLLVEHGGAVADAGLSVARRDGLDPAVRTPIFLPADQPARSAGMTIAAAATRRRLTQVGCSVHGEDPLSVTPPSWRPDLTDPADLVEEVVRLEGYDRIPSELPAAPSGHGLTEAQRLRRTVARAVASAGYVEVLTSPFVSAQVHDQLGEPADDRRRRALTVANPLSDAEPELRTSLLPGLLRALLRNTGRGLRDLALYEIGLVYFQGAADLPVRPGVDHRPGVEQLAALQASVPHQPRHLAAVGAGNAEPAGWWGQSRPLTWADAVELARVVAAAHRVELVVQAADAAPWHPGRCARLRLGDTVVGHAGELHPRVIAGLDLPPRTVAVELDLDAFAVPPPATTPVLSSFPPVLMDVALVVEDTVAAADVVAALRAGGGDRLEAVRLFDVYTDESRLGAGRTSLAFALRIRADRTLTGDEAAAVRDDAVARAGALTGAVLRS